jgi:hypothetical protein
MGIFRNNDPEPEQQDVWINVLTPKGGLVSIKGTDNPEQAAEWARQAEQEGKK